MNNNPQPSAPPLEPELQFQYITYPPQLANPQYIHSLPQYIQSQYNSNYYNHGKVSSEKNTNCLTYIAKCIAFFCCCFVVDETRV